MIARMASGQSQQAFSTANDLNYPRFAYWLRKIRDQGAVTASQRLPSRFTPVVVSPTGSHLSIRLPNGIELLGVTEQNAAVLEQLLAQNRMSLDSGRPAGKSASCRFVSHRQLQDMSATRKDHHPECGYRGYFPNHGPEKSNLILEMNPA